MEMYTIDNDAVGLRTLEHLASARTLGKQVYVIYDGLGSLSLPQKALAALRGSMFLLFSFSFLHFSFFLYSLFNRPVSYMYIYSSLYLDAFEFNPLLAKLFSPAWKTLLYRNHRKIVTIDGKVGFIGGMNISRKYAGLKLGTGYFKDIQVKVEGPAAAHLEGVVNESLLRLRDTNPSLVIDVPNSSETSDAISTEGAPVWVC